MARREPHSLLYAVDERPPWGIALICAVEHLVAMVPGVVIVPLIIATSCQFPESVTVEFIRMALLASSLSTLCQWVRTRFLGAGLLIPMGSSGTFIPMAIAAGSVGGVGLICGMTLLLVPLKLALAPLAGTLARRVPSWIKGGVILLIAASLIPLGFQLIQGEPQSRHFRSIANGAIGFGVIALTFLLLRFRSHIIQISSLLIAMSAGFVVASLIGIVDFSPLAVAAPFEIPRVALPAFAIEASLILPFAIATLVTALETLGDVHAFSTVSHRDRRAPSSREVRGALVAGSLGSILSSLFGTVSTTTYSGHAAIIEVTRVASRGVAWILSGLMLLLFFSPWLSTAVSLLPYAVIGGVTLMAAYFMMFIAWRLISQDATSIGYLAVLLASAMGALFGFDPSIIQRIAPTAMAPLLSGITLGFALLVIGWTIEYTRGRGVRGSNSS